MIVDILDIGSGNIKSIQNWIEKVNVSTRVVTKATDIKSNFVILPGVGSAGPYMDRLRKKEFDKAILDHIDNNGRLMGICLGFQIMGYSSEEDGGVEGLGILDSHTKRLDNNSIHNGWEEYIFKKSDLQKQSFQSRLKLTRKQNINGRVFFNHEYGVISNAENIFNKKISNKYNKYSSIIVKDNIIGIQFHPEKSQKTGLDIISMIL
jgi:glutamine amidotransferase